MPFSTRIERSIESRATYALACSLLDEYAALMRHGAHPDTPLPVPPVAPTPTPKKTPRGRAGGTSKIWERGLILAVLGEFYRHESRFPTRTEWREAGQHGLPGPATVRLYFATLQKAYDEVKEMVDNASPLL